MCINVPVPSLLYVLDMHSGVLSDVVGMVEHRQCALAASVVPIKIHVYSIIGL